jgi:hypothetical protein
MENPPPEILCPLCNRPIMLQVDLSADENGKAVHTECYAKRISTEQTYETLRLRKAILQL